MFGKAPVFEMKAKLKEVKMTPKQVAEKYLFFKLGYHFWLEETDNKEENYQYLLSAEPSYTYRDKKSKEEIILRYKFPNISEIIVSQVGKIIKKPTYNEIQSYYKKKFRELSDDVAIALLKAQASQFGHMLWVDAQLTKIYLISSILLKDEYLERNYIEKEKSQKWIDMMLNSDLARISSDKYYVAGNKLNEIFKRSSDIDESSKEATGVILGEQYETLKKMKIRTFSPYIRITRTFWEIILGLRKLSPVPKWVLADRYRYRGKFGEARFEKYLTELDKHGILTVDGDQVFGNSEIYEEIKKNQKIKPWVLSALI